MIADVSVVGAGPAGTAAAITLARAGLTVVLLDKARFPRDKTCGDGLTASAIRRYRDLGLTREVVDSWTDVNGVVLSTPSADVVMMPLDEGLAAVARRADLDAAFVDVARTTERCQVFDGHEVTAVSADEGGITLSATGVGDITAHYVIAADGMWSAVRKALGPAAGAGAGTTYLGDWHAFRQYFVNVAPTAANSLWVWFEADLLPGYAWSFPLGEGRANVGFGVLRSPDEPSGSMKTLWRGLLDRPHIGRVLGESATAAGPHRAWPIPARLESTAATAAGGRVLYAGDAARAADPMTGEGIGQALESGTEAARAILRSGPDDPAAAARRYVSTLERTIALDNRLARSLSTVLAAPNRAELAIKLAGATAWTRRNFARWLFEDYPRAVIATPWRW